MPASETKKLILSSKFEEVEKLEPYLEELQEWIGFGDDDYARIMLTLSEAATNAIMHGNKEDPSKKVRIRSSLHQSRLTIDVRDEGKGFDRGSIPDPLKEENLLKQGGRGVYLIEEYADEVTFSENGTKLSMVFELKDN